MGKESYRWVAVTGLIGVIVLAAILTLLGGEGIPFPFSLPAAVVMILLLKPIVALPVLAALFLPVYYGWVRPAWTGRVQFTKWTWLGLAVCGSLSVCWYWAGWSHGVQIQGMIYVHGCAVLATLLFVAAAYSGFAAWRHGRNGTALLGRWLALVWAATYGYPWLGELL